MTTKTKGLFVFENPKNHVYTRASALIASFYLVYAGRKYNNWIVQAIGWATMIWDAMTLKLTLAQLRE
jgi:hypothetical protein